MSLVSRHGTGAAPVVPAPSVDVDASPGPDNSPETRAARRAMFTSLGWSTSAPGSPAPIDVSTLEIVAGPPAPMVAAEISPGPVSPVSLTREPYNYVTGAQYRGKNVDRLYDAGARAGYRGNAWAGFQQWLSVGRVVRKGEHGTACVTVIGDRTSSTEPAPAAGPYKGEPAKKGRGVRGFRVFHYDQTTALAEVTS